MPLHKVDGPRFSLLHAGFLSTPKDAYAGAGGSGSWVGVCDRSYLVEFESFAVWSFEGSDPFRCLCGRRVGLDDMSVVLEVLRGQLMARDAGPGKRSDH